MEIAVRDGDFTSTIYGHIKQGRYADTIKILSHQLKLQPNARAALSLLGYCYYHTQVGMRLPCFSSHWVLCHE
jgi:tetratricopeptide repeat protein 30